MYNKVTNKYIHFTEKLPNYFRCNVVHNASVSFDKVYVYLSEDNFIADYPPARYSILSETARPPGSTANGRSV